MLNDLWMFSPKTEQWTWMSGSKNSNTANAKGQPGIYGTMGVASGANVPGSRGGAVTWTTPDGKLWLFGGDAFDVNDRAGTLNDLWAFDPSTKMWIWVSGSNSVGQNYSMGPQGVYGQQGVAAAGNVPGGRYGASGWVDASGRLWLFGGTGYDVVGQWQSFNDMWMFDPGTDLWSWMAGSASPNATGVYGSQGTADAGNAPGARNGAVAWTDNAHSFWLFGGNTFNDLWKFDPATKMWTWAGGSNSTIGAASYGKLGSASASNIPGGRNGSTGWVDGSGSLWLLGGSGYDSTQTSGTLNDLWRYQP